MKLMQGLWANREEVKIGGWRENLDIGGWRKDWEDCKFPEINGV